MICTSYSEAITEVLAILDYTEVEAVNKISKKFLKFLEENSLKTYNPKFDTSKSINELNLNPKTEALLGIIYLNYWANGEEREAFKKKLKENEIRYQETLKEKFSTENMFQKNTENIVNHEENIKVQETNLTEIKKETLIQKIINKIKKFLGGR